MIYLKLDKKPKTVKELLNKLFDCRREYGEYSEIKNVETYKNIRCTQLQCGEYRYRSFDDVYDIVTTYFPTIKRKQVIHELLVLKIKEGYTLGMSDCHDIRRIVLYYCNDPKSYYPKWMDQYDSDYSWKELLSKLSIKTEKSLNRYVNKYK